MIKSCDDSCYKCLKTYRNMNYHGLLDWRLGVSWLRLMMDKNYKCATDGDFSNFVELNRWPAIAKKIAECFSQSFQGGAVENHEEKLYGLISAGHPVIVIHPLWDINDIREEWLANARIKLEGKLRANGARRALITIDSFNE